ncbi:MAG: ATP-binding cassette domain-containing protein [Deltaproteobacteria bacterium]|nr:ATP-binding cassette domain-containing protein [Deltaproteobacteria bacterium]
MTSEKAIFEARGLRKSFDGRTLFDDLSFSLAKGGGVAIVGPSGSGKTQVLRALALLNPLDSGAILLDGQPASSVPRFRADVAYIPQTPPILDGSPRDFLNVVEVFSAQKDRAATDLQPLLKTFEIDDKTFTRPWSELSGGERQRCQLAITMSRTPRILLLDEPTSALDDDLSVKVEAVLQKQTLVLVTHDKAQIARLTTQQIKVGI